MSSYSRGSTKEPGRLRHQELGLYRSSNLLFGSSQVLAMIGKRRKMYRPKSIWEVTSESLVIPCEKLTSLRLPVLIVVDGQYQTDRGLARAEDVSSSHSQQVER